MKTTIKMMVAVLLSTSAMAQSKGFVLGIKGGVNMSQLKMGDFLTTRYNASGAPMINYNGQVLKDNLRASFDSRTGWAGGVYARIGRSFYVQPEVMVSNKSGLMEVMRNDRPDKPTIDDIKISLTTIDVPLMVGLKAGPFRVNAGPMASFRVGDNQKVRDALQQYTAGSFNETMSQAIWGYQAGFGLDLLGLNIDVRREGMLSDIQLSQATPFAPKIQSWQVTVGFKLL